MLSTVWSVKKNTESWNSKVARTKNGECDSKKSKFIKQQEASGLLSSLGHFKRFLSSLRQF